MWQVPPLVNQQVRLCVCSNVDLLRRQFPLERTAPRSMLQLHSTEAEGQQLRLLLCEVSEFSGDISTSGTSWSEIKRLRFLPMEPTDTY